MAANLKVWGMIAMAMLRLALSSSEVEALARRCRYLPNSTGLGQVLLPAIPVLMAKGPRVNNSRKQVWVHEKSVWRATQSVHTAFVWPRD
jgi:hypothetical protein